MLVAHHLSHLGSSLSDAFDVERLAFNLTQFDAETTKFHLRVDAPHVLYLSLLVPAAEVAGVVHADRTSPAVVLHEGTVDERLCRPFRQAPIAAANLHACKAQLASHTLRHQVACRVDNEVPVVGHTLADGNVFNAGSRFDAKVGGIVGTLRRAIDIDDFYMVAVDAVHLLATTRREADRQVIECVEQQARHRRRVATTRYLMVEKELSDGMKVFANLCRHDVERSTQREHRIHVFDMGIERERAMTADAISCGQFFHVDDHGDEVTQTGLVKHGTLGLAR